MRCGAIATSACAISRTDEVESLSTNGVRRARDDGRMKTASWPGIVLALSAAVLWGTTGTSQHFAGAHLSPYWIGALRLAIAAVFFASLVAATERDR